MIHLKRNYVFLSDDVQRILRDCDSHIIAYPHAYALDAEQGGLWTVQFPDGVKVDECYLWTPERTTYHRYTLPDGMILVEPQDEGNPHRSLLILTPLMQYEYGMSRKEVQEGYPHITVKDTVKEILVPAQVRGNGETESVFLSGFGADRPGFRPIFVLFTYRVDGQREIYLIERDEVENPTQRYAHLREHVPAPSNPEHPMPFRESHLDRDLRQTYGIDWEQEIAERRTQL